MDRKVCILVYSKYSQACIDLLKYIHSLPFDFPSITGLSMMSVDNKKAKEACEKNGIKGVPVLLVEYFFIENSTTASNNDKVSKKQMLEKRQIYEWIDELVQICLNSNGVIDLFKKDTKPRDSDNNDSFIQSVSDKTSKNVTFLNSRNVNIPVQPSTLLGLKKTYLFDENNLKNIDNTHINDENIKKGAPVKNMSAAAIAAEMENQRKIEDEKFTKSIKTDKFGAAER